MQSIAETRWATLKNGWKCIAQANPRVATDIHVVVLSEWLPESERPENDEPFMMGITIPENIAEWGDPVSFMYDSDFTPIYDPSHQHRIQQVIGYQRRITVTIDGRDTVYEYTKWLDKPKPDYS